MEHRKVERGVDRAELAHFLGKMERKLAAQRLILPNERDRCVDIRLVVSQDIQQVRQIFVQHHIVALIEHAVLIGVFPNVVKDLVVQDLILFLTGDILAHQQEKLIHGGRIVLQQGAQRRLFLRGSGALEQAVEREGILLHRAVDGLQRVQLVGVQVLQAETQLCNIGRLNAGSRGRTAAAGRGRRDRRAGIAGTARNAGGARRARRRRAGVARSDGRVGIARRAAGAASTAAAASGEQTLQEIKVIGGNGHADLLHHVGVAFDLLDGRFVNARGTQQREHVLDHFAGDAV